MKEVKIATNLLKSRDTDVVQQPIQVSKSTI